MEKYVENFGGANNAGRYSIQHGLNTMDIIVSIYDNQYQQIVMTNVFIQDQNKIVIEIGRTAFENEFRAVIVG